MPEPKTLLVGFSAWRLTHSPASPGEHRSADSCAWTPTPECDFEVAVAVSINARDADFTVIPLVPPETVPASQAAGAPFAPQAVAEIPLTTAPPIIIRVRGKPTARISTRGSRGQPPDTRPDNFDGVGFFEATAFFVYEGKGFWRRHSRSEPEDETNSAELFAPPVTLAGTLTDPFVFALIAFFLARVRNRTRQALAIQREREPDRFEFVDSRSDYERLAPVPISGGKVQFVRQLLDLDNDCRVLEIKGFSAPAAVAVCWPRKNNSQLGARVGPFLRADPMESLIFFHASNGQNAAIYNSTPYPFGLEQIDHGFISYLNAAKHPLRQPYGLGLPYQIAAAGKQTVLVLPLNRVAFPELTNLNTGEQATELLEEIHASFLRAAGLYFWAPQLGRIALAAFSAAIHELFLFHRGSSRTPLLRSLVQEVYIFDSRHTNGPEVANYANGFKAWAAQRPERRVRMYNDQVSPGHRDFLGVASLPRSPFVVDSADGRFTSGVVSDDDWFQSSSGRDRFKFTLRRDLVQTTLARNARQGATTLDLETAGALKSGDSIALSTGPIFAISSVSGKTVTLDRPLATAVGKGAGVIRLDQIAGSTTLADNTAPGETIITVNDPIAFFEESNLVLDKRFFLSVTDVAGSDLGLDPMPEPFVRGTAVELFDGCIRTKLSADHASGQDLLTVFSGSQAGFRVGQEIRIGLEEVARIRSLTANTITIDRPLANDRKRGDFVGVMLERRLTFGHYHAMFVTVFLLDAMRKSGFR